MAILEHLPSPATVFSAYSSVSTSVTLLQTIFHQIVPRPLQNYLLSAACRFFKRTNTSRITYIADQFDGMTRNDLFDSFEIYMSAKTNPKTKRLKITKSSKDDHLKINFAESETVTDFFQGIEIKWVFVCEKSQNNNNNGKNSRAGDDYGWQSATKHSFELSFEKIHNQIVRDSYFEFVLERAKTIRDENKVVKLHTLGNNSYSEKPIWNSVDMDHPSTFDKLAMEPGEKKALMEDLDLFVQRKEYYKRVGRAWKRGYLLYGPPGTGKTSLIAAMANYLKFDIYDLQLMKVRNDSGLRKLLLGTTNRSIIVVEDIDCSAALPDRKSDQPPRDFQITLSGLLNFVDGLWSSCGDERIIIFTTNNKDELDPALLRPGRMDMHVHMSYLKMNGFKVLASNYLDIKDQHWRYREIEELIGNMKVTPAEIAEQLTKTSDADVCLERLVNFLKRKKMETNDNIQGTSSTDTNGIELPAAKRLKTNGWK